MKFTSMISKEFMSTHCLTGRENRSPVRQWVDVNSFEIIEVNFNQPSCLAGREVVRKEEDMMLIMGYAVGRGQSDRCFANQIIEQRSE